MDDFSKGNGGRRVYRPQGSGKGVTSTLGTTYSGRDDMPQGRGARDDREPRRRHNFERKQRVQDEASQAFSGAAGLSEAEKESLEVVRQSAPKVRRVEKKTKAEEVPSVKTDSGDVMITHLKQLRQMSTDELFQLAEELKVKDPANLRRHEMMFRIVEAMPKDVEVHGEGVVEILSDGFGFLRMADNNYTAWPEDIYVSPGLIRRLGLRNGDTVQGSVRYPNPGERYFALVRVDKLNGENPESQRHRPNFDKLTPLYPTEKFTLEDENSKDRTGQVIDIIAPIGKGQRCMLVAPPKAGKTMMMKAIAHAIEDKHPEVTLIVLLIDERPEEVTDMQRSVKGEVVSSTFDEPANRHCQVAEMVIEKAKRLVEKGQDVVILLDSLTRLARAYNTMMPSSGKVLTGGLDANAMQRPKRFFGAARKVEEGGSLTIIATALIDTGSRMDEVIFEEFKGTGNSEIWLERKLVEKRVYPAIDITKSSTRHEEMLFTEEELQKIWILRRILNPMGTVESMEFLIDKMRRAKTNADFFKSMAQ